MITKIGTKIVKDSAKINTKVSQSNQVFYAQQTELGRDSFYKNNNKLSFNGRFANLAPEVQNMIKNIDVPSAERYFNSLGVSANFSGNKLSAACSYYTAEIFRKLNLLIPPEIRAFDFLPIASRGNVIGECAYDLMQTPEGYIVRPRGVNFNNRFFRDINSLEQNVKANFDIGHNSTDHFLHTFIHEFVHNVHDDILFKKFGYDGICQYTRQFYPNRPAGQGATTVIRKYIKRYTDAKNELQKINPNQHKLLKSQISQYGAENPMETVAEGVTEYIVNLLDSRTLMPAQLNKPKALDNLYSQDPSVNKIIRDAWYGIL